MERGKREIEVQKDLVGTVFWIKKINLFGVIGDGLHYQIPMRWKVDSGDVVFAKKFKTSKGLILGQLVFYLKWIEDIRTSTTELCCMATCTRRLDNRALEAENPEEDEDDECNHDHLRMQKLQGQGSKGNRIYEALFFQLPT